MLKLKIFLLFILFFRILPFTSGKDQVADPDSLLIAERDYYYQKYRSVRDTMTINTWLNLKRVTDNLEQVVTRDQLMIEVLKQRISSDSAIVVNLTEQNERQSAQEEMEVYRNKSELFSILYLKAATAVLLFICLILIYFLISRRSLLRKLRSSSDHYENITEEKVRQLETMDVELRRMKQRELDFRDELEKGMELNQERLLSLQEKCGQLEEENQELRNFKNSTPDYTPVTYPDIPSGADLPDNIEELKRITRSLYEERSSLMNLAGKLRSQYDDETRKNHDIIERISFLLNELSENKTK